MSSVLRQLGRPALVSLAQALEAERLKPSFSSGQLRGQVPEELLETVHAELKACLHAKCIVIDEERALITSANFTEAAQERNIEAGVMIADASLARALKAQFDTLVDRGALRRVPGL